ncbi:MAG: mechanosensitive ion channel [Gammaproteobacteria bacterium]|nr:mechanosensitive ion channel [Gammaproteobacteria bacterium]
MSEPAATSTIGDTLAGWIEVLGNVLSTQLVRWGNGSITVRTLLGLAVVLFGTWYAARLIERFVRHAGERRAADGGDYSVAYAVGRLARYAIWMVGVIVALQFAGLDLSSFALIGGAVGVGIGFGLQNIVSNFFSGIILLMERSLKVGDFVDLQSGVLGRVREIALRFTRVTTNDQVDVLVPNSEFVNGRVTNWTFDDANRRVRVAFGVAYGTDKELVREAGLAAAARVDGVLSADPRRMAEVWLVGLGDSSLNFELVVWVDRKRLMSPARTQASLLWALHDEICARGIEIPFPQRDLNVRSGVLQVKVTREPGTPRA